MWQHLILGSGSSKEWAFPRVASLMVVSIIQNEPRKSAEQQLKAAVISGETCAMQQRRLASWRPTDLMDASSYSNGIYDTK